MKHQSPADIKDGAQCKVTSGVHARKSGTVRDIKTGRISHVSIIVVLPDHDRTKTLAKNVIVSSLGQMKRGCWH